LGSLFGGRFSLPSSLGEGGRAERILSFARGFIRGGCRSPEIERGPSSVC